MKEGGREGGREGGKEGGREGGREGEAEGKYKHDFIESEVDSIYLGWMISDTHPSLCVVCS